MLKDAPQSLDNIDAGLSPDEDMQAVARIRITGIMCGFIGLSCVILLLFKKLNPWKMTCAEKWHKLKPHLVGDFTDYDALDAHAEELPPNVRPIVWRHPPKDEHMRDVWWLDARRLEVKDKAASSGAVAAPQNGKDALLKGAVQSKQNPVKTTEVTGADHPSNP